MALIVWYIYPTFFDLRSPVASLTFLWRFKESYLFSSDSIISHCSFIQTSLASRISFFIFFIDCLDVCFSLFLIFRLFSIIPNILSVIQAFFFTLVERKCLSSISCSFVIFFSVCLTDFAFHILFYLLFNIIVLSFLRSYFFTSFCFLFFSLSLRFMITFIVGAMVCSDSSSWVSVSFIDHNIIDLISDGMICIVLGWPPSVQLENVLVINNCSSALPNLGIKRHKNNHINDPLRFALFGIIHLEAKLDATYWINIHNHNKKVNRTYFN